MDKLEGMGIEFMDSIKLPIAYEIVKYILRKQHDPILQAILQQEDSGGKLKQLVEDSQKPNTRFLSKTKKAMREMLTRIRLFFKTKAQPKDSNEIFINVKQLKQGVQEIPLALFVEVILCLLESGANLMENPSADMFIGPGSNEYPACVNLIYMPHIKRCIGRTDGAQCRGVCLFDTLCKIHKHLYTRGSLTFTDKTHIHDIMKKNVLSVLVGPFLIYTLLNSLPTVLCYWQNINLLLLEGQQNNSFHSGISSESSQIDAIIGLFSVYIFYTNTCDRSAITTHLTATCVLFAIYGDRMGSLGLKNLLQYGRDDIIDLEPLLETYYEVLDAQSRLDFCLVTAEKEEVSSLFKDIPVLLTLQQLTRLSVIQHLGQTRLVSKVKGLPLPLHLKRYLLPYLNIRCHGDDPFSIHFQICE